MFPKPLLILSSLLMLAGCGSNGMDPTNSLADASTSDSALGDGGQDATVTAIAVGYRHNCAIVNGGAQCWGLNGSGQLGNGSNVNSPVPVAVKGLGPGSGVTAIAAGASHTCAIVNGAVKCWGENIVDQIGGTLAAGTLNGSWVPADVAGLDETSGVTAIAAGQMHNCALFVSGAVKCWGDNTWEQLGNNTTIKSASLVDVVGLGPGGNVTAIATGADQSCAIANGSLFCWGWNQFGDLGNNSILQSGVPVAVNGEDRASGVRSVACGGGFTCATDSNGVRCWGGEGGYGSLGNDTAGSSSIGYSQVPVSVVGLDASPVSAIGLGWFHACAIVLGGVQCWGNNLAGELGNGSAIISGVPVQVTGLGPMSGATQVGAGVQHTCALVQGKVWCWGYNDAGQLGNNTLDLYYTPVTVAGWAK